MRTSGILIAGIVVAVSLPLHAETTEPTGEWLGRRNPFRPLIVPQRSALPMPEAPSGGATPPRVETPPTSVLDRLEYVGIAYDEREAIAAVSDGERTWFVRKGDRLDGATVSSITPNKLTWSRKGRDLVKHLRREGVY